MEDGGADWGGRGAEKVEERCVWFGVGGVFRLVGVVPGNDQEGKRR